MDKCTAFFWRATVFATIDANNRSWQVEVEEIDRNKLRLRSIVNFAHSYKCLSK